MRVNRYYGVVMKKLSKDHIIDGQVYSAGTEYKIQEVQEWSDNWPELSEREWESMTVGQLEQYLDSNDVNAKRDRWTALMFASQRNSDRQVIQFLIDKGADVHAKNTESETALMLATSYNSNPEIIEVLIDNGADVDAKNARGETALIATVKNNKNPKVAQEIAQVLIDNGADVNAEAVDGSTPLMWARDNSNRQVIKTLLDNGARE